MNHHELRRLATELADQIVNAGVTSYSNVEEFDAYIDNAILNVGDIKDSYMDKLVVETRKRLENRLTRL